MPEPTADERVTDLIDALEASIRAAREARQRLRQERDELAAEPEETPDG